MKIAQFLQPEDIIFDLAVATKSQLINALAKAASARLALDESEIARALVKREGLGSTGIGDGTALPHAAVAGIAAPFALFARLKKPVDFESVDEIPVTLVCLLLMPPERNTAHLSALACIARTLSARDTRAALRQAATPAEVYAILARDA